jgi:hypothetical protein
VTVTSIENGLKRSVKTDDSGRFSFPQLKPGMYSVKAEADRFEAQQNSSVPAGLGQKQTADFKLNIASAKESILVQEQALMNTAGSSNDLSAVRTVTATCSSIRISLRMPPPSARSATRLRLRPDF